MFFHPTSEYFSAWKNNLLPFCVLLLPLPYLFSDLFSLNYADMYMYLNKAFQMDRGSINLFVKYDRSALFPFLLHLLFQLFGCSVHSIKGFYVFLLSVLCLQAWMICRVLTGNNSGIISAFFIASSFVFGHFTCLPHVDFVLVVCLNFCVLVLYKAVRAGKHQFKWIFLSGLLLGLTYALKQTAIVLVVVLPLYGVFSQRASLSRIIKLWGVQLIGVSIFLVPIAILSYPESFGYLWAFANSINQPTGAGQFSRSPSLLRIFTYWFDPVLWQWDRIARYDVVMVRADQIISLVSFVLFVRYGNLERKPKQFLILTVLVFLPWYMFVAYKGNKMRQLLFPTFMVYLSVGPLVQYFLINRAKHRLSRIRWLCLAAGLSVLLFSTYGFRLYSVDRSIEQVVRGWPHPLPLGCSAFGKKQAKSLEARIHKRQRARPFKTSRAKPRVEVKPQSLWFGSISKSQQQELIKNGGIVKQAITVTLKKGNDLKIDKVLSDGVFRVAANEVKQGRMVQVFVEPVLEKLHKGRNIDIVRILTNQEDAEILVVPVSIDVVDEAETDPKMGEDRGL
jgi:4-amino-4-deoxy-L-arabinose transferase-like glycosyltransferase